MTHQNVHINSFEDELGVKTSTAPRAVGSRPLLPCASEPSRGPRHPQDYIFMFPRRTSVQTGIITAINYNFLLSDFYFYISYANHSSPPASLPFLAVLLSSPLPLLS